MIKKFMIAITLGVFLSGCTVVEWGKENPASAALAVKSGTLAFVEQVEPVSRRIERAKEVIAVVGYVKNQIDSSTQSTVSGLAARVRNEIAWDSLDAYERLLLDSLIFSVQKRLEERIGTGVLDQEGEIVVKAVLNWAEQASQMYIEGRVTSVQE